MFLVILDKLFNHTLKQDLVIALTLEINRTILDCHFHSDCMIVLPLKKGVIIVLLCPVIVNSEIFVRILFSRTALKDIFAAFKICD